MKIDNLTFTLNFSGFSDDKVHLKNVDGRDSSAGHCRLKSTEYELTAPLPNDGLQAMRLTLYLVDPCRNEHSLLIISHCSIVTLRHHMSANL